MQKVTYIFTLDRYTINLSFLRHPMTMYSTVMRRAETIIPNIRIFVRNDYTNIRLKRIFAWFLSYINIIFVFIGEIINLNSYLDYLINS